MLRGSRVIIDARDVSFVIATTDWGKLREPFRSRVRAVMLEPYSTPMRLPRCCGIASTPRLELTAPVGDVDPAVAQLSEDGLDAIATAARAVPRVALDLLREIGMALRIGICEPGRPCSLGVTSRRWCRVTAKG